MENYKFKATLQMTKASQRFSIDIPIDIIPETTFLITTVLGKVASNNTPIYIHSPELSSESIWHSNGNNDLLSSCILMSYATKPITGYTTINDLGYRVPQFLEYDPNITLELRDDSGNLYADNEIDFVDVGIEFFNRGVNK